MSVFGGDSWGREAQHRKRRVDDLMLEDLNNESYKKLSNGKYACLVCPNNPLLDSALVLSMHNKGTRHIAAECRPKERELMCQEEIKKRVAVPKASVGDVSFGSSSSGNSKQQIYLKGKPLIQRTLKAAAETLRSQKPEQQVAHTHSNVNRKSASFFSPYSSSIAKKITDKSQTMDCEPCFNGQARGCVTDASVKMLGEHHMEKLVHRERELKFTAAGWKRDCAGRWFRDETVEFDSDEEDPNICLS